MKLQRDSISSIVVGSILLILLPLLAALQYRWLGQVSEGEREQLKSGLQLASHHISDDFDTELTRAFVGIVSPFDKLGDEISFPERYQHWIESAKDPRLIKEVYFCPANESGIIDLKKYHPDTKNFTSENWPEDFSPLKNQMEQRLKIIRSAFSQDPPTVPPAPNMSPTINGEDFEFLIPNIKFPAMGETDERPSISGFVLVKLDPRFIQQEMLPALIKQSIDINVFDVAVVSHTDPRKIIWESSKSDLSNSDTSLGLFGLRPSEFRNLRRNQPTTNESGTRRIGGFYPWGAETKSWELRIRHQAGSLDAAVAKIRRRNLVISSSILVLLVSAVTLLLISVQRAKKLAQQQMDFVATVSHELRTPLAVIDSAGYNLVKGVIKDQQQMARYGSLIRKETHRLQEMIEQILEFAGAQSGKGKYALQPTDLNQVIEEVLNATQPLLEEGHFALDKKISQNLPNILADSAALSRALQNLINNAMKYSGDSRWIELKAEVISTSAGNEIQISVADHGIGIPSGEQSHIFEPFYRGEEAKAAQIRGNGLGLSLVKNIIQAHQGKILVESVAGKGSKFTIRLPVIAQEVIKTASVETAIQS